MEKLWARWGVREEEDELGGGRDVKWVVVDR
jgi:hypothetical protein